MHTMLVKFKNILAIYFIINFYKLRKFFKYPNCRWGLAWTFDPKLQLNQVMSKKQMANTKPMVMIMPRSLLTAYSVPAAWRMVAKWLHYLKVKVNVCMRSRIIYATDLLCYSPRVIIVLSFSSLFHI